MILAYFQIGKMIVEDEQQGSQRAEYAKETLIYLSNELNEEFGKGYSVSNLEYMRGFYIAYQHRISQTVSGKSPIPFPLGWSQYVLLLKIKNEDERNFYEIEAAGNNWSVRLG